MDRDSIKPYVAGLLDGEGTVFINPNWSLQVFIYNSSKEMLELVQSYLGGTITTVLRKDKRTQYTLAWTATSARDLLLHIQPYLFLKLFKAKMGVLYYDTFFEGVRWHRLSDDEKLARQAFRNIVAPGNKNNTDVE